jgi:hypothetical protein
MGSESPALDPSFRFVERGGILIVVRRGWRRWLTFDGGSDDDDSERSGGP